jgi:hypothetical protein
MVLTRARDAAVGEGEIPIWRVSLEDPVLLPV